MSSRVVIDINQCTGCGNCLDHCPKNILELSLKSNTKYTQYPILTDPEQCINCGSCEMMCTVGAIHLTDSKNGFDLIDKDEIPPHAGCYLGSLAKAIADSVYKLGIEKDVVIFKKKAADIGLTVETYNYMDDSVWDDALKYKQEHPEKVVILVSTSSKMPNTTYNTNRLLNFSDEKVTVINTLNWYETENFKDVTGGRHMLEEIAAVDKASFVARGSVRSPKEIRTLSSYLTKALQNQIDGKQFAVVEMVFPCFYRVSNRPQTLMPAAQLGGIRKWFDEYVKPEYKEGILLDK